MEEHAVHLDHLKARIEKDEYQVDPLAVAAAILARLLERQNECS